MASLRPVKGSFFIYPSPDGIIAAGAVLPILGIIAVVLRFRVRLIHKARIGIDDWLIFAAMIVLVGMGIDLIVGVKKKGLGYSTPQVSDANAAAPPQSIAAEKVQYTFQLLFIVALGLIKLSFLFFYRRVFVVRQNSVFSIVTLVSIAIMICWTLSFLFAFAFNCGSSFAANWGSGSAAQCDRAAANDQAIVTTDFFTDLAVVILPLPILFKLHLPIRKKLGLVGVFLLGAIALGASLGRLIIFLVVTTKGSHYTEDPDLTVSTSLYWAMVEASLALIASCLPIIRQFLGEKTFDKIVGSAKNLFTMSSAMQSRRGQSAKNVSSEKAGPESATTQGLASPRPTIGSHSNSGPISPRSKPEDIEAQELPV